MCAFRSSHRALLAFVAISSIVGLPGTAFAQYVEPVEGTVVDPFRPPQHFGGPGNRGWEYTTTPGSPIRAAGSGVVTFAGQIGSGLYVSISHTDGLRTTYSNVSSIAVRRGEVVTGGSIVGRSQTRFHFGVIDHGSYVDPATLFGARASGAPMLVRRRGAFGGPIRIPDPTKAQVPVSGRYQ